MKLVCNLAPAAALLFAASAVMAQPASADSAAPASSVSPAASPGVQDEGKSSVATQKRLDSSAAGEQKPMSSQQKTPRLIDTSVGMPPDLNLGLCDSD